MTTYIVAFTFLFAVFGFMAFAIRFSRYRQNGRCCTAGLENIEEEREACATCPLKEEAATAK